MSISDENEKLVNELLAKIERQLKKYEMYPTDEDISLLIKDRVDDSRSQIICKQSIIDKIKESARQRELLRQTKINYYDTSWTDVLSMLFMYTNKTEESKKQLLRANYNLQSNNQLFRILNLIYNNDIDSSHLIDEGNYILKVNISFFIIEYIFEKIRNDLNDIINSTNDFRILIDDIIQKYSGDVQSVGDVLLAEKPKDPIFRIRYNEIKDYLKMKGFVENKDSQFKYMRNASSHGEFYPDFTNESNIRIIVEGNGVEKETINYLDLIGFVENKLKLIGEDKNLNLYLKLFRSNNLTNTILNLIDAGKKELLISNLCILSLFNIIQYNNENYFRIDKKDLEKKSYLDSLDLKQFFTASYDMGEKNNFEILQTIKNAIGHFNISFENGIFVFDNKMVNEQCMCSLGKLLLFITEDEIYNVTRATSYFEKCARIQQEMIEKLNANKIIKPKDFLSSEMQEKWDENGYSNTIDLSKYDFEINQINKKGK